MNKRTRALLAGSCIAALGGGGAAIATATGGDDAERPITGSALEQAEAAALEHTGEGSVTETEVGDEESLYEVEVTLDDGTQTDVQLDRELSVVGSEADASESEDGAGDD